MTTPEAASWLSYRQRQEVKDLCAVSPRIGVAVLSLAFIIEAINLHHAGLQCLLQVK